MTALLTASPTTLAEIWAGMWNDDPALAHELVTNDFRLWLGHSDAADALVGSAALEKLVRETSTVHRTVDLVAADAHGVAWTWTALLPDGTTLTGVDLATVRDGRLSECWSVHADRASSLRPLEEEYEPTEAHVIAQLCHDWCPMWNGEVALARSVAAPEFRIWFGARPADGDSVLGPDAMAAYVLQHRDGRPDLQFAMHRDPLIDVEQQRAAFLWTASVTGTDGTRRQVGGIDLVQIRAEHLVRCWSVTGSRAFAL